MLIDWGDEILQPVQSKKKPYIVWCTLNETKRTIASCVVRIDQKFQTVFLTTLVENFDSKPVVTIRAIEWGQ